MSVISSITTTLPSAGATTLFALMVNLREGILKKETMNNTNISEMINIVTHNHKSVEPRNQYSKIFSAPIMSVTIAID